MEIDRAIEILDPEHREHYESIEPVNEACRMGMKALRDEQANCILTLEELLQMDAQDKIWICYPQTIFQSGEDISCSRYKFSLSNYGETWIAFREKPHKSI